MTKHEDIHFVSICQPRDSIQAGMIRGALQDAGLTCHVENENFSAIRLGGGMGIGAGAMRVMVPSDQVEKANVVLKGLGIDQG